MCTIFPHRRDGIYWVGVSGVTKKKKIREASGTYNNWNFPEGLMGSSKKFLPLSRYQYFL